MRFLSRAFGVVSTLLLSRFLGVQSQACILQVPANPLTAAGLATPYIQTGCTQASAPSFVEGVIVDLTAGTIKAYNPLVVDAGTKAAVAPVAPNFGTNTVVVGLWFGTNGASLTLQGTITNGVDSLLQGNCVNGGGGGTTQFSTFGQFAACNARAFFDAAMAVIANGQVKIPVLGKDFNGNTCPTTRDFGVVDQDQSDNVVTSYLLTANTNLVAQNIPANVANFAKQKTSTTTLTNGSDNRLLSVLLDSAINCTAWHIPDMADLTNKQTIPTLATNELQARLQNNNPPVAFVPAGHAMTLATVNNNPAPDLNKMNAYRTSVNQAAARTLGQASTTSYCMNMYSVGAIKILQWLPHTAKAPSPDPASANLGAFMVNRFNAAVGADNLNCVALLKKPSPLAPFVDANGNLLIKPANAGLRILDTPSTATPNPKTGTTSTPLAAWVLGQAPVPAWDQLKVLAGVADMEPAMDSQWGEPMIDTATTPDLGTTPAPQTITADGTIATSNAGTTTSSNTFQTMSFGIGIGAGVVAMALVFGIAYLVKKNSSSQTTRPASNSTVNFSRISSPSVV